MPPTPGAASSSEDARVILGRAERRIIGARMYGVARGRKFLDEESWLRDQEGTVWRREGAVKRARRGDSAGGTGGVGTRMGADKGVPDPVGAAGQRKGRSCEKGVDLVGMEKGKSWRGQVVGWGRNCSAISSVRQTCLTFRLEIYFSLALV